MTMAMPQTSPTALIQTILTLGMGTESLDANVMRDTLATTAAYGTSLLSLLFSSPLLS
jgi:hypothetical protein